MNNETSATRRCCVRIVPVGVPRDILSIHEATQTVGTTIARVDQGLLVWAAVPARLLQPHQASELVHENWSEEFSAETEALGSTTKQLTHSTKEHRVVRRTTVFGTPNHDSDAKLTSMMLKRRAVCVWITAASTHLHIVCPFEEPTRLLW